MNKIFVVATKEELKLLEHYNIDNSDRIIVTGIGAANVFNALNGIERGKPIINVGYCGSNVIPIGTQCRIIKSSTYHPKFDYKENVFTMSVIASDIKDGVNAERVHCFTSTDFVTSCDFGFPCVFDMELAFICMLGFNDVRADKWVSDNLSVEEYNENSK